MIRRHGSIGLLSFSLRLAVQASEEVVDSKEEGARSLGHSSFVC